METTLEVIAESAPKDELFGKCKIQISFKPIYDWTNDLLAAAKFSKYENFARKILPNSLFGIFFTSGSYYSRLFTPSKAFAPRYARARNHLLDLSESKNPITFEIHPECVALTDNWIHLFERCDINPQNLAKSIRRLLDQCIVSETALSKRLQRRIEYLLSKSDPAGPDTATGKSAEAVSPFIGCAQAMATLSLIACTLFCWNQLPDLDPNGTRVKKDERCTDAEKNDKLYNLVLPSSSNSHYIEILNSAEKVLDRSKTSRLSQQECEELLQELSGIVEYGCEKNIQGWAYYLLYLVYRLNGNSEKSLECLEKSAKQGYKEARSEQKQIASDETAMRLFAEAENLYNTNDKTKIRQAYLNCKRLLALRPEPSNNALIGRAALLIYRYSIAPENQEGQKSPLPEGETPEQYLIKSRDCGNEDAQELCEDHLGIIPRQLDPDDGTEGIYYFNCCNPLTKQIQESAPKGWELKEWDRNTDHSIRLNHKDAGQNVRCYFLDDDQMVNLHDALCLLESLLENEPEQAEGYYESLEIYLRGQSEFLRPLIDTAVGRMGGRIVPIYIIDDDLWPAQWLLARHPLFYPIRSLPAGDSATLNLVVVGNTRCSEWIVREAFALMGFINSSKDNKDNKDDNIICEITVIAPCAERLKKSLYFKCPGMSDDVKIKKLSRPKINFLSCEDSFQNKEIESLLIDCYQQQDASCYYVIDTDNDAVNLSLATKLREMIIRKILSVGTRPQEKQQSWLNAPPPIAFRCRDPFMAHLSKRLVVEMENYGNQWYNSFGLIPFGSDMDRYNWQDISGSFYEKVAKNIHLQYNFAYHNHILSQEERDRITREALTDYFRRSYNRESSLSVAISLPYRLFQFEASSLAGSTKRPIPPCWQITDSNAYCSEIQLNALVGQLRDCMNQADRVAEWEHDRWSRWMLSRGWKPESIDQALNCHAYGNKRPQLFLARLHPCICAYDELGQLANAWETAAKERKDFTWLDQKVIRQTSDILELEWYGKEPAVKEKLSEEKERG